jgi:hypothetical protein
MYSIKYCKSNPTLQIFIAFHINILNSTIMEMNFIIYSDVKMRLSKLERKKYIPQYFVQNSSLIKLNVVVMQQKSIE